MSSIVGGYLGKILRSGEIDIPWMNIRANGAILFPITLLCSNPVHAASGNGCMLEVAAYHFDRKAWMPPGTKAKIICNSNTRCTSIQKSFPIGFGVTVEEFVEDVLSNMGMKKMGLCPRCHLGELGWGTEKPGCYRLWCSAHGGDCWPKTLSQLEFELLELGMEIHGKT